MSRSSAIEDLLKTFVYRWSDDEGDDVVGFYEALVDFSEQFYADELPAALAAVTYILARQSPSFLEKVQELREESYKHHGKY